MLTPLNPSTYARILAAQPGNLPVEDIELQKLAALAYFSVENNPADLVVLAGCLDDTSPSVRDRAAEVMIKIFGSLSSRRRLMAALKPVPFTKQGLYRLQAHFSGDTLYSLLAMASFNADGYVRHKATRLLAASGHKLALRFLLYRLSDNVNQIRNEATDAIKLYQQPEFFTEFLLQIPLIANIRRNTKADNVFVLMSITRFLTDTPLTGEVLKLVAHRDTARKALLEFHLNRWGTTGSIIRYCLKDHDFQIRKALLYRIDLLNQTNGVFIYQMLCMDRCAEVRIHALKKWPFPEYPKGIVTRFVSDTNLRVRKLACLKVGFNKTKAIAYYKKAAREYGLTSGIILGLSDFGCFERKLLIEGLSTSDLPLAEAALTALRREDGYLAAEAALLLLDVALGRLRKYCIRTIGRYYTLEILEEVIALYKNGDPYQRKSAVRVFGNTRSWHVFAELILALSDPVDEIRRLAMRYVKKWTAMPEKKRGMPLTMDALRMCEVMVDFDASRMPVEAEKQAEFGVLADEMRNLYKDLRSRGEI